MGPESGGLLKVDLSFFAWWKISNPVASVDIWTRNPDGHLATFGIVLDSRKGILPKKNVVARKQVWTYMRYMGVD